MNKTTAGANLNPLLTLIFGAVCISFAPVFVKLLPLDKIGPTAIGFWRMFCGGMILFILAGFKRQKLLLPRPLYFWSLLAGFLFFLDLFVWHRSIIYAGAGMATILGNTQVFATGLLSFILFKEQLTWKYFMAAFSALVGVAMLVGVVSDIDFTVDYIKGIVFGLLTGLAYANYLIALKSTMNKFKDVQVIAFMAWTSIFSSFFLGSSTVIEGAAFFPPDRYSYLVLFSLGLVAQALGWWSIFKSLSSIPAARAGLILLLQPILAMVWGILFFREQLDLTQVVGAAITLTAIYFGSVHRQ
ncbi:MAG: DMT family transporter [Candidatus Zixiibacteriota bacterium]